MALILVVHHIIWDAESTSIAVRELNLDCDSLERNEMQAKELVSPRISYLQFAREQRAAHASGRFTENLRYWSRQLAEATADPTREEAYPSDKATGLDFMSNSIPVRIGHQATARVQRFAHLERSTIFMVLTFAWFVLLHVLQGASDLVTGIDISERDDPRTWGTIGLFVNQVAIRVDLSGNPTLLELSRRVRRACLFAYEHKDAPFDLVVRELKVERRPSRDPVFETKIYYVEESASPASHAALAEVEIGRSAARHELSLGLTHRRHDISGYLTSRNSVYRHRHYHQAARAYTEIVSLIGTRSDQRLSEVVAHVDRLLQPSQNAEGG
jgi:hypothetical protein